MPSLADLVRASQANLPITIQHESWLINGAKITPEAADFTARALKGEVGGARVRGVSLFRASGAGQCKRKRTFSRLQMSRDETLDGRTSAIFLAGNFIHLKWQTAGLSAGWLAEAEVAADRVDLEYGGTLDGVLADGTGLEVKSINTRGFAVVMDQRSPMKSHLLQVHTYMALTGIDTFSVVYEDKNNQDWKEFRVVKDSMLEEQVGKEMDEMREIWATKSLPPVLPDCQRKTGFEYQGCPYRKDCLKIQEWPGG